MIAIDKTGTLTLNKMMVTHLYTEDIQPVHETLPNKEERLLQYADIRHDAMIIVMTLGFTFDLVSGL